MIRRVLSQPGPAALTLAALPPGTPVTGPLRVVYLDPAGVTVSQMPADALVSADGAPFVQTGPGSWGQVVAAGRPR
ncbi:MAG TPA: hypothetical protein VGI05_26640 [Streptosporangiaceae bacterium]